MNNQLQKVQILFEQGRYKDAKDILNTILVNDPNDPHIWGLMAELELQDNVDIQNAFLAINKAISLDPNYSGYYFTKSRLLLQQNNATNAAKEITNAITLDPDISEYHSLFSTIKFAKKDFEGALDEANTALELDPENVYALNARSSALMKLGRKEESIETIDSALHHDPNSDFSHSNYGWALLEKGDPKKAMDHFKESLTQNPENELSQTGMIEALKATNPIYRWFLKYAFWMEKQTSNNQWIFIFGIFLAQKLIRNISRHYPQLSPILMPIFFIIVFFALSTWIIGPISNLFLRFNPYGKFLLDEVEKKSSNLVAIAVGVFIIGIFGLLLTRDDGFLALTIFGFTMMIPTSIMLNKSKYNLLFIGGILMAVTGILTVIGAFTTGLIINRISMIYLLLFLGYQFGANFLIIKNNSYK